MRSNSNLFRRLSIIFLILSLVTLFVIAGLLILSITDDAIVCPEDRFICYYEEEFMFYQNTIVGLGLIMALLIIMSRFFQLQIKYVAEYSGYSKSISEEEQKRIEESTKASSALKEYFQLLEDKKNSSHQMSLDDYDDEPNEDALLESNDDDLIMDVDIVKTPLEEVIPNQYDNLIKDEDLINPIQKNDAILHIEDDIIIENNHLDNKIQDKTDDIILMDEPNEIKDIQEVSLQEIDKSTSKITESETKKVFYVRKTKVDFYNAINKETSLNKTKSKLFLNTLLNVITEEVSQGNIININEFGKFRKVTYKEQERINPKTGKKIIVKAHSIARFYPHKNLKEIVDKGELDFTKKYLKPSKLESPIIEKKEVSKTPKIKTLTKSIYKTEIISKISTKSLLSKNKSQQFLNAFISVLTSELKNENTINIPDFGKFKIVKRAPKEAVNPQSLERIFIKEHNSVKLLFDKFFKEKINLKK